MDALRHSVAVLDGLIETIEKSLGVCDSLPNHRRSDGDSFISSRTKTDNRVIQGTHVREEHETVAKSVTPISKKEIKKIEKAKRHVNAKEALPEADSLFHLCDLRVGRVVEVNNHPEADGLYVLRVAVGTNEVRTVCAGLRHYIPEVDVKDKFVVLICNLKPRKLRGVDSEAMCLAGSLVNDGEKEEVVPLSLSDYACVGSLISVRGITGERAVVGGKFLSGKNWDKVVSRLGVVNGIACYDGREMIAGNVSVLCNLPNGAEIH